MGRETTEEAKSEIYEDPGEAFEDINYAAIEEKPQSRVPENRKRHLSSSRALEEDYKLKKRMKRIDNVWDKQHVDLFALKALRAKKNRIF